ncbi:unnamed protein product [Sphacelaria rigidula]
MAIAGLEKRDKEHRRELELMAEEYEQDKKAAVQAVSESAKKEREEVKRVTVAEADRRADEQRRQEIQKVMDGFAEERQRLLNAAAVEKDRALTGLRAELAEDLERRSSEHRRQLGSLAEEFEDGKRAAVAEANRRADDLRRQEIQEVMDGFVAERQRWEDATAVEKDRALAGVRAELAEDLEKKDTEHRQFWQRNLRKGKELR